MEQNSMPKDSIQKIHSRKIHKTNQTSERQKTNKTKVTTITTRRARQTGVLVGLPENGVGESEGGASPPLRQDISTETVPCRSGDLASPSVQASSSILVPPSIPPDRSEERRVGKECKF